MSFSEGVRRLITRAEKINSRLILALDVYSSELGDSCRFDIFRKADELLSALKSYVVGVKIGLPTTLYLGLDKVKELIDSHREYFFIADFKLADIGYIDKILCRFANSVGFDGIIAHSSIGYEGGLKEIVNEVHRWGGAVFAVVAMSHKGAEEFLNRHFLSLLNISLKAGVDGFILPATMPKYISSVRRRVGREKVILSPGVVKQGAKVGAAVRRGADFEIIGRGIYASEDPVGKAREYSSILRWSK